MIDLTAAPTWAIVLGFLASAALIAFAGTRISRRADVLADRMGWGEALVGAVLLGGATSLPGIITSVTTAYQGHPSLSIANAVGGIAVQTAFLGVADLFHRRSNLEHAAASAANLSQGALLVSLLGIALAAAASPDVTVFGVHPASAIIFGGYLYGIRLLRLAKEDPMWFPRRTAGTQGDADAGGEPDVLDTAPIARLWTQFALLALALTVAGLGIGETGIAIAGRFGLAETAVGGLLTAVATSLPELVTSIAAVRRGALNLAVGGIIGGNAFDTIFLASADVAYRDGSLYHRMGETDRFVIAVTVVMTGVLLLGLLRRERSGPGNIGFESVAVLVLYGVAAALMGSA